MVVVGCRVLGMCVCAGWVGVGWGWGTVRVGTVLQSCGVAWARTSGGGGGW